jgi:hypothetical protein
MRALVLGLCASRVALAARYVFVLDQAWRFNDTSEQQPPAGPCASAGCSTSTDDHAWRLLDLPHDFVVEGNFSQQADASHGFLPYGCAWYRKTFTLPPATAGATFWLDLDGAADSPEILGVMQGLADVTLERRILGSYPRGEAL